MSKTVWRLMQTRAYRVSFDEDFAAVIRACAPGPDVVESFTALHEAGHAHSVEVRDRSGRLAGGLYGVSVGRAFFTEKMFSRERDAANVGFVTLSCHLQHWGYAVNDGKRMSGQLSQLGFMLVPRFAFNGLLVEGGVRARARGVMGRGRDARCGAVEPESAGYGQGCTGHAGALRHFHAIVLAAA